MSATSGKSRYLASKYLDHALGRTSYTPPATVYLTLYTLAPTPDGGGTEVSAPDFAPLALANDTTNFSAAVAGVKHNGVAFAWDPAVADWGTIVAWGLKDGLAGDLLYWGLVTPNKPVMTGDVARVSAGSMTMTES